MASCAKDYSVKATQLLWNVRSHFHTPHHTLKRTLEPNAFELRLLVLGSLLKDDSIVGSALSSKEQFENANIQKSEFQMQR